MNPGDHITPELFDAARRGEISAEQLVEILRGHLETVCPACREASETARREETPRSAFGPALARVRRKILHDTRLHDLEREARQVPELIASLKALSPEQRLLRIRNAPERYANHALIEEIFARARACLPSDPAGSAGWAETALAVSELHVEPYPAHGVRALAFLGNAARGLADFETARDLLERAEVHMTEHRIIDLEVEAELHSFFGSLWTDLQHFDEASRRLDTALHLYSTLEDDEAAARIVMQLSNAYTSAGHIDQALDADRQALALLCPEEDPRLYIAARVNYAFDLMEAEEYATARDILWYDEELIAEHADPHTRLRVRWLEGRIAVETGETELAEQTLVEIRDHFAAEGLGFDCAQVCLQLADLYHRQDRHHDVVEEAGRAVRLFESHEIHREALAALLLVRDAAAAERLGAEGIRRVAAFLEAAAQDPAARFDRQALR